MGGADLHKNFASESNLVNVDDDGYESSENLLLDPEHPLLKRYQFVVHDQLSKLQQEMKFNLKENEEVLKRKQQEYKTLGESIMSVEADLSKLRQNLESKSSIYESTRQEQEKLTNSRNELNQKLTELNESLAQIAKADKSTAEELRRIDIQIGEKKADAVISDHMKIVKNAVKKANQDLKATKQEKAKQDVHMDKMLAATAQVDAELNAIDEELKRVKSELNDKRDALIILNTEIQAVTSEKRSLLQLWNSAVSGMKRKGDELASFEAYLKNQRDEAVVIENELNGLTKEYTQNRDKNDNLASMLIRLEQEVKKYQKLVEDGKVSLKDMKKQIEDTKSSYDILNSQLSTTEKERSQLQSHLNALIVKIRFEQKEIAKLEDEVIEWSFETQTKDRTVEIVLKELKSLHLVNRELEKQISEMESQLAEETMAWAETEERLATVNKTFKEYKELVTEKQTVVDKTYQDVTKRGQLVDKAHGQFALLAKKLNGQTKGGPDAQSEVAPLKNEIMNLQKTSQKSEDKIFAAQAQWLKMQDQMIKLNEKVEHENVDIEKVNEKINLYESMKVRLNGEMKQSRDEIGQLERSVENLRTKIRKMNEEITKQVGAKSSLESERLTAEGQLAGMLRESEMEFVQLEDKLRAVKTERERALQKIEDAKKQISLWEEKVEKAKATKDAVSGSKNQEDLIMLRGQVHRMQLRCAQLTKQQEIMLKEMEKAVSRREILLKKGEAATSGKTSTLTQTQLDSILTNLRRKVKQYKKDLESGEGELEDCRNREESLKSEIQSKILEMKDYEQQDNDLKQKIDNLTAHKYKNLQLLIAKQVKHKNLEDAREGRYRKHVSSLEEAKSELAKETQKRDRLATILTKLYEQFPHLSGEIKKAELLLEC